MHSNPFSSVGYDLNELKQSISRKANEHEVSALRSHVDGLERTNREISATLDGVRSELQIIRESFEALQRRVELIEEPLS